MWRKSWLGYHIYVGVFFLTLPFPFFFIQNFKLLCCQSETYSSLVVAWVLMSLETLNDFTQKYARQGSQCPKHFLAVAQDRLLLFTNAGSMVGCSTTLTHKLLWQWWLQCIFSGISVLTCNMYARRWTRIPCHLYYPTWLPSEARMLQYSRNCNQIKCKVYQLIQT